MARHAERYWTRLLRWLMPATGTHASPEETGEMPVLPPEPEDLEPETRTDFALDDYYDLYAPSIVRPYVLPEWSNLVLVS